MSDINNSVVMITGASRGIGKVIAQRLASEHMRFILTASKLSSLDSVRDELSQQGCEVKCLAADFNCTQSVEELAQAANSAYGELDILINNAGTSLNKPLAETTTEEWERCLRVNATAPFILCRDLLPLLAQSSQATIINIGSVVGIKGYPNQAAYGASKHALMGFSKVLAQEAHDSGVRLHTINPGGVYTDMVKQMRPDLDPSGLIQPEDLADLIHYLLTHRANMMLDDLHPRRANGTPWF